jgi:hypothetical protein
MTQSLPFSTLSLLGSDLTSLLLIVKDVSGEDKEGDTLEPAMLEESPENENSHRIESLVDTIFGPSSSKKEENLNKLLKLSSLWNLQNFLKNRAMLWSGTWPRSLTLLARN